MTGETGIIVGFIAARLLGYFVRARKPVEDALPVDDCDCCDEPVIYVTTGPTPWHYHCAAQHALECECEGCRAVKCLPEWWMGSER